MKLAYSVKQKMKIATFLFAIMACTILIRFLEDESVKSMNTSFVSLYNDRLVPATDLFYIAEYSFAKKYAMDNFLYAVHGDRAQAQHLKQEFYKLDAGIDSLIRKYEKTFMVKPERQHFQELKGMLSSVMKTEQAVIALTISHTLEEGRALYETAGRESSKRTVEKLTELMHIQTQVGQELIQSSASMVSRSNLYSAMQMVLAIMIGVLIVGIISASNVTQIRQDKFNLN